MSNNTMESVLSSLGYTDPMDAARQQARMLLLGRLSRYEVIIQQIESRQEKDFEDLHRSYEAQGSENWVADDDYLTWQWYRDAIESVKAQLATLSLPVAE